MNLSTPQSKPLPVRVLLVDDQASIAQAIRLMLQGEPDITLYFCQDPTLALKMAEQVNPNVILQDLVMPQMEGLQLTRYFRAHPKTKEIPLIVLSANEDPSVKAKSFEAGANDYLVKLPDRIELLARVRYHASAYERLIERNLAYSQLRESQELLQRDLVDAAEYVRFILPPPLSEKIVQIDWRFLPCTTLGGDFFGYHWIDSNHFAIYLLDVCGHGVGAALLSVTAANVLQQQALPQTDFKNPAQVLYGLNQQFQMEQHRNMFFTIWYGVYDVASRLLTYSSAGHPPAVLVRFDPKKPTERLYTPGLVIGALAQTQYQSLQTTIEAQDVLFILSDGMCEIFYPDGHMIEFDRLVEVMEESRGRMDVDRLLTFANGIQQIPGAPAGPLHFADDVSLIEMRFS